MMVANNKIDNLIIHETRIIVSAFLTSFIHLYLLDNYNYASTHKDVNFNVFHISPTVIFVLLFIIS